MTRELVFGLRVIAVALFVVAAVTSSKVRCEWLACACLVLSIL